MARPSVATRVGPGVHAAPGGRVAPTLALLGATLLWGSTFVVTKSSLDGLAPADLLTWRFGLAAVVLLAVRPRAARLRGPDGRRAVALGLFVATGFLLQTGGLLETPAGVSGFLTGTAVVLTPVVARVVFQEHAGRAGWVAVALSAAGVTLLAAPGAVSGRGALLTIAGAGCFAFHIAGLSRWARRDNAYGLTVWSVAVAGAVCGVATLAGGGPVPPATGASWAAVLYLALGATCVAFVVQAWAQSHLSATTAAVVMTAEPLVAAVVAAAATGERIGVTGWVGGGAVVAAMLVAELAARRCCDASSPRIGCC